MTLYAIPHSMFPLYTRIKFWRAKTIFICFLVTLVWVGVAFQLRPQVVKELKATAQSLEMIIMKKVASQSYLSTQTLDAYEQANICTNNNTFPYYTREQKSEKRFIHVLHSYCCLPTGRLYTNLLWCNCAWRI